ncbi:MAG: SDR family NAD(P)-dependent oxidoreductase [Phycisphaeraceae bacterium]|nr:SDR family NAD(P)-dependent oxidoreductase [Phycisphaeraceae bacterium]
MKPLADRIAVVTGASAGIGESIARFLAAAGAKVVVNARREERLHALVRELGGTANAAAVAGDAADQTVIQTMLDVAKHTFGGGGREADLVVVNAGRGLRGSVYDSDSAQWEDVIRINLLGAARLMRAAAERMAGPVPIVRGAPPAQPPPPPTPPADWLSRPRDIVILGSTVGRHISPFSSMYGSAKAGVHMLAESLRRLMAPRGVRITLLEPGIVKSEFQDAAGYDRESFGKFMDAISPVLTPEDISRLVMFIVTQPAGMHICDVMVRPTRQEYP